MTTAITYIKQKATVLIKGESPRKLQFNTQCKPQYIQKITASFIYSLILLFALNSHTATADDDIVSWLSEKALKPISITATKVGGLIVNAAREPFTFETSALPDSSTPELGKYEPELNSYEYKTTSNTLARAYQNQVIVSLTDKFKLGLFRNTKRHSDHKVYINTLKQQLVGKSIVGKARYELRVSEDEAEAQFSYIFN